MIGRALILEACPKGRFHKASIQLLEPARFTEPQAWAWKPFVAALPKGAEVWVVFDREIQALRLLPGEASPQPPS